MKAKNLFEFFYSNVIVIDKTVIIFKQSITSMATGNPQQTMCLNVMVFLYNKVAFLDNSEYVLELVEKMEKFIFNKEIGSGSFGKVFLVEEKRTGIHYVLKQIDLNKLDKKQRTSASREVEVLSKLKHANIVRYKESYEVNNDLNIIMEYCENGDLHKKVKEKRLKNELFTDAEILDYFVQICMAVEYIHNRKILHRDLKTKNIFLTKGNTVKLGDFGVAKVLENSFELASTCIGSPYYISPEICENKPYNKKSDIWSLGCVLYELSTLKYAFVAKNVKVLIAKITSGSFNPLPANINTQIRSLLINLLKSNPKDRPSASEILNKPFITKYKFKHSCESASFFRIRSNSGDDSNASVKLNNNVKVLSNSCTKLNDLNKGNKFVNITKPEAKYKVPFIDNKLRAQKKFPFLNSARRNNNGFSMQQCDETTGDDNYIKNYGDFRSERKINSEKSKLEKTAFIKLSKIDSEYYKLIAETNTLRNKWEINKASTTEGDSGVVKKEHVNFIDEKSNDGVKYDVSECRRKWMADTYQKNELLTVLNETELIDVTSLKAPYAMPAVNERSKITVDDLLKLDPSEMSEDILKPVKIDETVPVGSRISDNYLNSLKEEIKEIKAKFEANNRNFDVKDLMRLTENSRKILKEEIRRKYLGDDTSKAESDSVYFELELKRMQLEKTVGLNVFLMSYRMMIDILNGNIQNDIKDEPVISGTDTYVIRKEQYPGDHKKTIESVWMAIIEEFGTMQEYIPEIWECAVRESVYY